MTPPAGLSCEWLEETPSTNDTALDRLHRGAPHGHVIVAARQSRGRGRHGRAWLSPAPLGLWCSILLRPQPPHGPLSRIPLAAGLAVARTLAPYCNQTPLLKWPNDVLVAGRKIAGLLAESHHLPDRPPAVILGIGINISHQASDFPTDLPATSLRLLDPARTPPSRRELLEALHPRLMETLAAPWEETRRAWLAACAHPGTWLRIRSGNSFLEGLLHDIDDLGCLVLRHESGLLSTVHSGELLC